MRRWTNQKLHKELTFAVLFDDPMPQAREWLRKLRAEASRRGWSVNR